MATQPQILEKYLAGRLQPRDCTRDLQCRRGCGAGMGLRKTGIWGLQAVVVAVPRVSLRFQHQPEPHRAVGTRPTSCTNRPSSIPAFITAWSESSQCVWGKGSQGGASPECRQRLQSKLLFPPCSPSGVGWMSLMQSRFKCGWRSFFQNQLSRVFC